jgi:hypothetical protein
MTAPPPDAPARARLLALLLMDRSDVGPFCFATHETLAFARTLEPQAAAEVVSSVLRAYLPGADHALAERAAHVAHELGLAGAVPALVACVERLPQGDRAASVACAALELLGGAAIGPLVEAFARARNRDVRFALGLALTSLPQESGEIRAAFEGLLDRDPELTAHLLGILGDRRAVPALRAALGRLELPRPGPDELLVLDPIVSLGEAVLSLGGRMTKAERRKFEDACARADALGIDGPPDPDPHLH